MRSLPLLLTARLLPVVALATAGWAWTSGPYAPDDIEPAAAPQSNASPRPESGSGKAPESDKSPGAEKAPSYEKPPEPCKAVAASSVKKLVPNAKTAGKEIELTDPDRRRTCSWSGLKEYDYRWLDVSYEVFDSPESAEAAYAKHDPDEGKALKDLGDAAALASELTTKDKQQTREAVVVARSGNALVTVTYNGCDFDSRKAPSEDTITSGAEKAARAAMKHLAAHG